MRIIDPETLLFTAVAAAICFMLWVLWSFWKEGRATHPTPRLQPRITASLRPAPAFVRLEPVPETESRAESPHRRLRNPRPAPQSPEQCRS